MDTEKQNGAPLDKEKFSQLILTFDRNKCELTTNGVVQNYNEAINMLGMAIREFEAKIAAERVNAAMAVAAPRGFQLPLGRKH